ncbi:MAG: TlpA family protein disulfide reductase [Bacteroidetes bacterium]|nr:TlpA family protein disulfide reductase [Bacteroidota bacterium]
MMAQQVPVYKIGDLLKRIHNASDTVYVVNFWATWCKPCVAELPEFEKLHTQYKDSMVKVLLVSLDFKEDMAGKLIPFLRKNNYTTNIVLLDEVNGNSFINQVSEKWSGAIPATLITTRNKSRQVFLEKKLTEAVIVEEIKKLQTP